MKAGQQKSWLSPLQSIIFLSLAATGILMVFDFDPEWVETIHKFSGITFIISAVFHLFLNWKPYTSYYKKKKAFGGLLVGLAVVLIAVFLGVLEANEEGEEAEHDGIEQAHDD